MPNKTYPPNRFYFPRVKICGLTRIEDVQAAVQAGADAVGFVFYPLSPRAVTAEQAAELRKFVPPFVQLVGLFVDVEDEELVQILATVHLDLLQFHGDETPDECCRLGKLTGKPWIKAIPMKPNLDINAELERYHLAGARAVLLDTWDPVLHGGTGQTFDWQSFPQNGSIPADPTEVIMPLILAGGLTPNNVAEAIRQTRPFAVDVSGGVESAKGIKNPDLIWRFIEAVRSVDK